MAKRSRRDSDQGGGGHEVSSPYQSSCSHSEEPPVHTPKYVGLETTLGTSIMHCTLPPHKPMSFVTYAEYETHYQQAHTNRCTECSKNLPSAHFLELHIAENHDPLLAARREKGGKTFACFVEGCDKVCSEWTKRRSHLVDKHCFPKNYDFFIVDRGIDGRRSMLRSGVDAQGHRKSSRERRASSATMDTESTGATSVCKDEDEQVASKAIVSLEAPAQVADMAMPNASVDELASSMSSLQMVPRSITFGRRKGRAGLAKS